MRTLTNILMNSLFTLSGLWLGYYFLTVTGAL